MAPESVGWAAVLTLGIWHGVNPGMGWLFAVALGMQNRSRRAVWRALLLLALGHAIAIAGTLAVAALAGWVMPAWVLSWAVAAALVTAGIARLVTSRHPRYGGMRITGRELTVWSALMASAHGAGLMVVPFVLAAGASTGDQGGHAAHLAALPGGPGMEAAVVATLVHTTGYLIVAGLLAVIVYERVGVAVLRRLWINLDAVWAVALIVTGLFSLAA